jgi:Photosynthetic reaction centre cytochrome C subunit
MSHSFPASVLVLILCFAAVPSPAQVPDKFTNLQYFPKDIAHDDLMQVMRGFSFSLNVRCQYCHAGPDGPSLKGTNFASDEKQTKKTARAMLRMVEAINKQYISRLESKPTNRVECVTCHHGLSKPVSMNALLAETIDKKGLEAALDLYRDLRKKSFGTGQYDFGETPLNQLTESLLKQNKTKEAATIMEMNVEVNAPPSMWTRNLLAMSHSANKETEKAKADFQKILDIDPENAFAKQQLEKLNGTNR